jgi:hypothetical protein
MLIYKAKSINKDTWVVVQARVNMHYLTQSAPLCVDFLHDLPLEESNG